MPGINDGPGARIRRRAAVACRHCHARKVRCNVATAGRPCANCQHDSIDCEILPRKPHGPRRKQQLYSAQSRDESHSSFIQKEGPFPLEKQLLEPPSALRIPAPSSQNLQDYHQTPPASAPSSTESPAATYRAASTQEADETEDSDALAVALDAPSAPRPGGNPSQIYIGDQQGPANLIFSLCNGASLTGTHFLVPRLATRRQKPEDLAYLQLKGCFSLPAQSVCNELVHCYFSHVHPFLPILNAHQFLEEFANLGCQNLSVLLIWSMFFAAANFVEPSVLQKAGYHSRKAMKRAMYQRAKCLYDSDYEEDKISLIQSVILMAFWYSDTEDRTGAYHWIGIAISLCQSLGLHRNSELNISKHRLPTAQLSVLRRIWWSCVLRDRWLSLGMGRPMRINPADCEVPMPSVGDAIRELESIPAQIRQEYIPINSEWLASLWVKLISISDLLGRIIDVFYKPKKPLPNKIALEQYENELMQLVVCMDMTVCKNSISILHAYQYQLFYEAIDVVLHRPYIMNGTSLAEADSWQGDCHRKAKAAAARTNGVLESLIDLDMIKFLKPMTITTLIPAMQIHLIELSSPTPLFRRFGKHKFQLCMMVLSELRSTYWGADAVSKLFEHALARVQKPDSLANNSRKAARSDSNAALLPQTPASVVFAPTQHDIGEGDLQSFYNSDGFMWDENNPFSIVSDEVRQQFTSLEWEQNNGPTNLLHGINSLLSLEQFNSQCLDMGPT
ncbi:hypothetical protein N431DRAFT_391777 [Stipitochalara longipes BDJ]|nr:hypothetical protein N431DRAFT_391777 [Stipitochalara longipes BDJ]